MHSQRWTKPRTITWLPLSGRTCLSLSGRGTTTVPAVDPTELEEAVFQGVRTALRSWAPWLTLILVLAAIFGAGLVTLGYYLVLHHT